MANKNTFFRTMGKCPIVGTEAGPELHVQEISVYVTAKELRNVSSNGSDKKVMDLPLYITGQTENLKQVFGGAVNPTKDGDVLINASVWGKDAERAEAAAAKNSARRIYVKVCGAIRVNVFQKQDGTQGANLRMDASLGEVYPAPEKNGNNGNGGAPAAPGYGASPAAYGAPPAGYGAPAAGYGAPPAAPAAPAAYGAPAGYGAPPAAPAAYGAPPAGYGAPAAGYGAPPAPAAPAAPATGYGAPAAGYGAPPAAPAAPAAYGAPAAGYGAPPAAPAAPAAPAGYGAPPAAPAAPAPAYAGDFALLEDTGELPF